jgi:hypothetical protein
MMGRKAQPEKRRLWRLTRWLVLMGQIRVSPSLLMLVIKTTPLLSRYTYCYYLSLVAWYYSTLFYFGNIFLLYFNEISSFQFSNELRWICYINLISNCGKCLISQPLHSDCYARCHHHIIVLVLVLVLVLVWWQKLYFLVSICTRGPSN